MKGRCITLSKLRIPNLTEELESLLRQIPAGKVSTFGGLGRALGDVGAARWVSQAVRSDQCPADCPVHRVVLKDGTLGVGDPEWQTRRLAREGVAVEQNRVDLSGIEFEEFECSAPLEALKRRQEELPKIVELSSFEITPSEIAAVDLSYLKDNTAVGCYAVVETVTGNLVWSETVHRPVPFPYISGYLAYRELPILLDLIEHVRCQRELAEVVFVDGNGILHPRRAGIATHLGVMTDLRTVGVGKKLLCGNVDLAQVTPENPQPIRHQDEEIGRALKAEQESRPVFVSPGHRINVPDAVRLARLLFHGHRLPEPVFQADALSRAKAKAIQDEAAC